LGLFLLALLSKTATVMLPAVLPVIFWWQRGRLSWKGDLLPLSPFFLASGMAGMVTVWVEHEMGAAGSDFNLSLVQRCLLAGRAIWFYLGKLCWPADLLIIYPRWNVSQIIGWQYLFPAAALSLLAVLWRLRWRWRGPLAGLLFFTGTLFPVLGFFNVYFFRFSFVADHFQYLASIGIIALFAAGAALLLKRAEGWRKLMGQMVCLALLSVLALLSWRQSRTYADVETLYRATIDRNPDCWLAHYNLGNALARRGQLDAAIVSFRQAVRIKPDYTEAHNNLGTALLQKGQLDEAVRQYQNALDSNPDYAVAHYNLGNELVRRGRVDEGIAHYQEALRINRDDAEAHNILGVVLAKKGRLDEAIFHYQEAVKIKPDNALAHSNLAAALVQEGRFDEAIVQYQAALDIKPDYAQAHNELGNVLAHAGQKDDAIDHYRKAIEIQPEYAEAHYNLATMLGDQKRFSEAITQFQKALDIEPDLVEAHNNLGATLALCGQKDAAIAHFQKAVDLASARNNRALADRIRGRIRFLQSGAPVGSKP
jgi:tetratricopeptide (TPR) repeat protein